MSAAAPTTDEAFACFSDTLETAGLRAALACLLGLTDYRFIASFAMRKAWPTLRRSTTARTPTF